MGDSLNPAKWSDGRFKTVLATVAVIFGAGASYAAFATQEDVVHAMEGHTKHEYPHNKQFEVIKEKVQTAKDAAQAAQSSAAAAQDAAQRTDKQVWALNAKIEFLVENEVMKARTSPQGRQRTERAARSVRDRAAADAPAEGGTSEDPLGNLDL